MPKLIFPNSYTHYRTYIYTISAILFQVLCKTCCVYLISSHSCLLGLYFQPIPAKTLPKFGLIWCDLCAILIDCCVFLSLRTCVFIFCLLDWGTECLVFDLGFLADLGIISIKDLFGCVNCLRFRTRLACGLIDLVPF